MEPAPRFEDAAPPELLDRVAFVVSGFSSPFVVLPLFISVLIVHHGYTREQATAWAVITVGFLVGLPLLYIVRGLRRGTISDLHVGDLAQRRRPFLVAVFGAALAGLVLRLAGAPDDLQLGAAAVVINGGLFGLISLRWKISMHPSTLAACAVLCGMVLHPWWFAVLLLVPLVMWARVRRRRHDWAQGIIATLLSGGLVAGMVAIYQWLGLGMQ